uniref:Uncharacterized protein n=1 Tax=Spongospora subterranea TaxID=70186 RepID=A0A0H5R5T7_9EUKA|eukprot:CRZ03569.1 hypothetical protein [Spongospora subterranea]
MKGCKVHFVCSAQQRIDRNRSSVARVDRGQFLKLMQAVEEPLHDASVKAMTILHVGKPIDCPNVHVREPIVTANCDKRQHQTSLASAGPNLVKLVAENTRLWKCFQKIHAVRKLSGCMVCQ